MPQMLRQFILRDPLSGQLKKMSETIDRLETVVTGLVGRLETREPQARAPSLALPLSRHEREVKAGERPAKKSSPIDRTNWQGMEIDHDETAATDREPVEAQKCPRKKSLPTHCTNRQEMEIDHDHHETAATSMEAQKVQTKMHGINRLETTQTPDQVEPVEANKLLPEPPTKMPYPQLPTKKRPLPEVEVSAVPSASKKLKTPLNQSYCCPHPDCKSTSKQRPLEELAEHLFTHKMNVHATKVDHYVLSL
ncbi:hypothetical protein C8R45DRAFT_946102 [Mycena sanguinolenta]|nr:hypothetical protein C8R45DRAFT_946102 [Mycena sanguinolenta]